MDLSLAASQLLTNFMLTPVVSFKIKQVIYTPPMKSVLLVGELKTEHHSGKFVIPGVLTGEKMVSSAL